MSFPQRMTDPCSADKSGNRNRESVAPPVRTRRRVVLVHNMLWTPYKAPVFSELSALCKVLEWEFIVVHVAERGEGQRGFGHIATEQHNYRYKVLFRGVLEDIASLKKVLAVLGALWNLRPDVAVLPGYSELYNWFALGYCMLRRIPRIVAFDSTEMDKIRTTYKECIKRAYIYNFHRAMTYGAKSREYIHKLGMPMEAIYIRCQAANMDEIRRLQTALPRIDRGREKKRLLYVGRLSEEKNLRRLISAFNAATRMVMGGMRWDLVLVGDGPQGAELKGAVAASGVDNILFEGGVSWSETVKYYSTCDAFILPSLSEPWGVVVNEAMCCGLPVLVSSKCGAAYDLVTDGVNGYRFDPSSEEELQKVIGLMISRPEELKVMGERSRAIIEEYSPKNAALQMQRCIQSCLS
jgi:glycosyltransferase involved in cell wall biosynthesis